MGPQAVDRGRRRRRRWRRSPSEVILALYIVHYYYTFSVDTLKRWMEGGGGGGGGGGGRDPHPSWYTLHGTAGGGWRVTEAAEAAEQNLLTINCSVHQLFANNLGWRSLPPPPPPPPPPPSIHRLRSHEMCTNYLYRKPNRTQAAMGPPPPHPPPPPPPPPPPSPSLPNSAAEGHSGTRGGGKLKGDAGNSRGRHTA
ncbi:hypothetical protein B0H17DRAFT_1134701 [Mycena rosella]|uniref:Uncharacterized protein n=1 Tax=Mycena rosella TaxID=1033263 RepID=A0AAD7DF98_MYCRO|nr:hypothetical protein B0H17DRAFT_1134701 [Mycena rosella]